MKDLSFVRPGRNVSGHQRRHGGPRPILGRPAGHGNVFDFQFVRVDAVELSLDILLGLRPPAPVALVDDGLSLREISGPGFGDAIPYVTGGDTCTDWIAAIVLSELPFEGC